MRRFRSLVFATSALVPLGIVAASANPQGAQVVGGSATVQGQGTAAVTVTQSTDKAIINWKTFNIGNGETTRFIQPSASSVALNRVTGGLGPSQIFGTLSANGRIFLVNPDGILFGPNSKIDTAGFLATTSDIKNNDFIAGRYNFMLPGRPDASIVNQGTITAESGGFAALVAPGVRNSGTITARLGTIGISSGNGFTLDFYGDRLITLGVSDTIAAQVKDVATGQPLDALIKNEGKLKANGGRVELTAVAARQVVDAVINNTGRIEANSVGLKNGMIVLGAATAATKPIITSTQTVRVSGSIVASGKRKGTTGGAIRVTGENIQVVAANLDASGQAGGGKVLIGGDTGGGHVNPLVGSVAQAQLEANPVPVATIVSVDGATTINAAAKASGDGGKVVVWSDGATAFAGAIKATGGVDAGNGGFVEVSGKRMLAFNGAVNTRAPQGRNGTLLLDPQDVIIGTTGPWIVTPAAIQSALASGDVIVTTGSGSGNGDITVAESISWSNASALTLSAYRDVAVNASITNSGGAAVSLRADNAGIGVGTVSFGSGIKVSTSGPVSIFYNPSVNPASSVINSTSYVSPVEDYSTNIAGGGTLTAYMLVNSVYDLQNVQNNLSGNYALGKDIDASSTASWNAGAGFVPIGRVTGGTPIDFLGIFDGLGHTIDGLTINSSAVGVGLFGIITAPSLIQNIGLTNASVTGTNPSNFVGGLVGYNNRGTISQAYVTGIVSGVNTTGGLVGINYGTITQSFSSASVSGSGSVGGLVGHNANGAGVIAQSYSTGSVTGSGTYPAIGGLAGGNNAADIAESYATGNVQLSGSGESGGLVGVYNRNLSINNTSYWDTGTSGQSQGAGAGTPSNPSEIVGLSTSQLKASLPTGFDPAVWAISPSVNSGYPYLKWQTEVSTATTLTGAAPTTLATQPTLPTGFTDIFGVGQTVSFLPAFDTRMAGSTVSALPVGISIADRVERGVEYIGTSSVVRGAIESFVIKWGALATGGPQGQKVAEIIQKLQEAMKLHVAVNQGDYLTASGLIIGDLSQALLKSVGARVGSVAGPEGAAVGAEAASLIGDSIKIAGAVVVAFGIGFVGGP